MILGRGLLLHYVILGRWPKPASLLVLYLICLMLTVTIFIRVSKRIHFFCLLLRCLRLAMMSIIWASPLACTTTWTFMRVCRRSRGPVQWWLLLQVGEVAKLVIFYGVEHATWRLRGETRCCGSGWLSYDQHWLSLRRLIARRWQRVWRTAWILGLWSTGTTTCGRTRRRLWRLRRKGTRISRSVRCATTLDLLL